MMRLHVLVLLPLIAFAACSKDETPSSASGTDAGAFDSASPAVDGAPADAGSSDAPAGPSETALEADINGVKRPLDRAQFGTEKDDAGATLFYIEAHAGGDPACPSTDGGGVSPDRTFVLSGVPRAAAGKSFTKADGVSAAYFDFAGDQLTGAPLTKATAVTATIVAVDDAPSPKFVEVDVDATFPEGTVKGRIHAEYCASMSQ